MNTELEQLSQLCFKEKYKDFETFINDFKDFENFKVKYEKLLLKWCDKEDFDDFKGYRYEDLFVIFGKSIYKTYSVDWSGEEYVGEIKKSLTNILKTYNKPTFKWNKKKFESNLNISVLKRGEYITLLFKALDEELNKIGFQMLFIELFDDEYHYTILPKAEIKRALELQNSYFQTYDSKLYEIKITELGNEKPKVMKYLKNKFSIPLNEIQKFANDLPISLGCSNILSIRLIEEEIKNLNCKYEIIEK